MLPRVALGLSLALLVGCGGNPATVTGRVTLNGQPLTSGAVTFFPVEEGPAAYGFIGSDGAYSLKTGRETGLQPGTYKIAVGAQASADYDFKTGKAPPLLTPGRYASHKTSGLSETVNPGANRIDLDLKSP